MASAVSSGGNLQESAFTERASGIKLQVTRLVDTFLYPLSRLAGPQRVLNSKVAGAGGHEWRASAGQQSFVTQDSTGRV